MIEYKNPPIQKVVMSIDFSSENSDENHQSFQEKYSVIGNFEKERVTVTSDGVKKEVISLGSVFEIQDNPYRIILEPETVRLERMYGYDSYEDVERTMKSIWRNVKHTHINAISLMYSNIINIEWDSNIEDYLIRPPHIPNNLPQECIDFKSEISIPLNKIKSIINITQKLVAPKVEGKSSVQIDLLCLKKFNDDKIINDLWVEFSNFRPYKNHAFEGTITDKAREMFL